MSRMIGWLSGGVFFFVSLWGHAALGAFDAEGTDKICQDVRQSREKQINHDPEIELQVPLRVSGRAGCFSPAENLFLTALVVAQEQLGPNAPWYKKRSLENKAKSERACEVLGYGANQFGKSMRQCVSERFSELMLPYSSEYKKQSAAYINKRNMAGEDLMNQCLSFFYRKLPELPRSLYFPLAYYNRKVHSYPDWYIEKKMQDTQWLQNMGSVKASDILAEAVGDVCPGDMIWWLYMKL